MRNHIFCWVLAWFDLVFFFALFHVHCQGNWNFPLRPDRNFPYQKPQFLHSFPQFPQISRNFPQFFLRGGVLQSQSPYRVNPTHAQAQIWPQLATCRPLRVECFDWSRLFLNSWLIFKCWAMSLSPRVPSTGMPSPYFCRARQTRHPPALLTGRSGCIYVQALLFSRVKFSENLWGF